MIGTLNPNWAATCAGRCSPSLSTASRANVVLQECANASRNGIVPKSSCW